MNSNTLKQQVQRDNIPAELIATPRWIVWRTETNKQGKPTKVPYRADQPGYAKAATDSPGTFCEFATAAKRYQTGGFDGIGFVLTGGGFTGIDLDGCRNLETGELTDWAAKILSRCGSYAEFSPSGWIKIIGTGDVELPRDKPAKKKLRKTASPANWEHFGDKFEVAVHSGGYFTITGDVVEGFETLNNIEAPATRLVKQLWPDKPKTKTGPASNGLAVNVDATILEALIAECDDATDRSQADFHLCCEAIERGWNQDAVWAAVHDHSKFVERGRDYFDLTWNSAANTTAPKVTTAKNRHVIGNVELMPGNPRQTPSKISVDLTIRSNAKTVDLVTLTTAEANRAKTARLILTHVEGIEVEHAEAQVQRALGSILVAARSKLNQKVDKTDGETIRDIVSRIVPDLVNITQSLPGGKCRSESLGDINRAVFVETMRTSELMAACEGATDAPRDNFGQVPWATLHTSIGKALEILWADIRLDSPSDAIIEFDDLQAAIIHAWNVIRPLGKERDSDAFVSCSMAALARKAFPDDDKWQRLHNSYDAWIRATVDDGEITPHLAMKFSLFAQTCTRIEGIKNHKQFAAQCAHRGLSATPEALPRRLNTGGKVMVLGRESTCEIMELSWEDE